MDDRQYQKKLEEMRQRHELDKQVLMAQYQQHASSLQHHHQLQLQKHLELVLSQQKQHLDALSQSEELANVKNKDKDKESAVASTAVKRHLQNFVIGRQKGKMDGYNNHSSKPGLRWHHTLIDDVDHHSFESPGGIHPSYSEKCDFPLRKTASEPNLKVRSRLKQKLSMEQRSSPLLPRQDTKDVKLSLANRIKKKINAENPTKSSSMTGLNLSTSGAPRNDSSPSSSARMETGFFEKKTGAIGNTSTGDLYTSPSLPNITLGANKRHSDHPMLVPTNEELSRLVSRTASLPGPLLKLPPKQNYPLSLPVEMKDMMLKNAFVMDEAALLAVKSLPDYEKDSGSLPPSHGPIRPSPISRSHRALIRTQSAPTSVASQLQQHILQKKQHKSLKHYQEQKLMKLGAAGISHERQVTYPVYYEADADKKELYNRLHGNLSLNYLSATERENLLKYEEKQRQFERQKNAVSAMSVDEPLIEKEQNRSASVDEIERREPPHPRQTLSPPAKVEVPKSIHRPLQRTQSSPAASLIKKLPPSKSYHNTTGIAYSPVMLRHGCSCGDDHTENAGRLRAIWSRLTSCGLIDERDSANSQCELIECRKATTDELELVHTQDHVLKYGTTSLTRKELDLSNKLIVLPCGGVGVDNKIDVDTVWNEQHTVNAARMAVGCTVDIALLVAQNKLKNGFALVRPPGHHAEKNLAMAFCYFNSIAVATRKLQVSGLAKKVLILDWDIHHCNGTQNIFYDDPTVLVISIHRYDHGNFFPGTGAIVEIGSQDGVGRNVNIAFSSDSALGDADYLAAFRTLVLPIARQYVPDVILVSCGFSAASGHSEMLGGYTVTPQCYGYLTQMLMKLTNDKLIMALEGGFELEALCDCTETCIRTLRGETNFSKLSDQALTSKPNPCAVQTIRKVIAVQEKHWKKFDASLAECSHAEWISLSRENETCNALASLTVNHKSFVKPPLIGETRKLAMNQRITESPPSVEMEEDVHLKPEHLNDSHISDTISNESSPLDVVNTSNPSSPLNGVREERLLTADPPT